MDIQPTNLPADAPLQQRSSPWSTGSPLGFLPGFSASAFAVKQPPCPVGLRPSCLYQVGPSFGNQEALSTRAIRPNENLQHQARSTHKNGSPFGAILESRGCSLKPSNLIDVQKNVVQIPGYPLRVMIADRYATLTPVL